MSQHGFGSFAPVDRSGGDLSSILEALQSGHIGTARPSYVEDGMVWHKHRPLEGAAGIIEKYFTFGGVNILEGAFDLSTGNFSPVFATQAEAEAGTDTAKAMNALRVKQSILANADVGALTAGLSFGDVGTYGFFVNATIDQNFVAGSTYAGSFLRPAGVSQNAGTTSVSGGNMGGQPYQRGSSPSGTWRAMGSMDGSGAYNARYTVFMRIA